VNAATLRPILNAHINKSTTVMTDDARVYLKAKVGQDFAGHESVNHSRREYSRGTIHTNTVEGYFSVLKRGLVGTFHHVGEKHLQRYVKEFDFRYNTRTALGVNDTERTDEALKGISGKRLTYRRIGA
jgi:transposase-like protein